MPPTTKRKPRKNQRGGIINISDLLKKDINLHYLKTSIYNKFFRKPDTVSEKIKATAASLTNTVSLGKLGGTRKHRKKKKN
jgi:hypothetical protein